MSTPAQDPAISAGDGAPDPYLPPIGADDVSKPVTETRPEILVGAAFVGGLILAKLLGRARGG